MTRSELADLMRLLVNTGRLNAPDASRLLSLFDSGSLTAAMLPLSVQSIDVITTIEAAQAQAAVVARLTPTQKSAYMSLVGTNVTTQTPPAIQKWLRVRTRNHFRGEFDRTMTSLGRQLNRTGDVQAWQGTMQNELKAYYIRQHTAGVGRPPTPAEIARLSQLAVQQQAYLQRFAGEVSARQALGNPMSGDAIGSRSQLYGGPGWEEWHRGNESAEVRGDGTGTIVHYRALDDDGTCSPCSNAARNGPYLVGHHPWPGPTTCEGLGRCRCSLEYVYDMEIWTRLSGGVPPPVLPPTEEPVPGVSTRQPETGVPAPAEVAPPVPVTAPKVEPNFDSPENAKAWFAENNVVDMKYLNLDDIPLEMQRDIGEVLLEMKQKHNLPQLNGINTIDQPLGAMRMSSMRPDANDPSWQTIDFAVSKTFFENLQIEDGMSANDYFALMSQSQDGQPRMFVAPTFRDAVYHESVHYYQHAKLGQNNPLVNELYKRATDSGLTDHISGYASANADEFFAEMATQARLRPAGATKFIDAIGANDIWETIKP